ncbi:PadR family transcriptional regulator [Streptomyces sp. WM6378]|uniref:PadR family transcriptional regulator n=1 Tax=Streptomyces sp. WM6378 TaxID=1415557 RepID=UPI0006AE90EF|nr:PadR family transcriptional regulator [Streptomyces sp. WM6378]KOU33563.1 PadR family transcriptional regulator [Streptomyces sp. WM6378]
MTSLPRSSPLALTVLALLHYKPLHPYGIQRLIKDWGKEQVVNVGQRASLYRTIERLLAADLIAVRETGRDQQYPERTVYEVTEAGREVTRAWLDEMLAVPKAEFPQFPAALSHALMLAPHELLDALERRLASVGGTLKALDAGLAAESESGLPRIASLESEYLRAITAAEVRWLRAITDDLREGRLPWSAEDLMAFAAQQESGGAARKDDA